MIYYLFHKDIPVCVFELENEVTSASINRGTAEHLPLPLRRLIHFPSEFVESTEGDIIKLSESGCDLVDFWLNDRTIPTKRKNLEKYVSGKNTLSWMLENHACSLDNCYWVHSVDEKISWADVKLFGYDQVDILTQEKLASSTKHYSGINSTLGGELEKYWFCEKTDEGSKLMLCKRTSPMADILSIREVLATQIYEAIGYKNHCHYDYVMDRGQQVVGCYCPAYTSEQLELVTAYDLLEEYNLTQQNNLYEILIEKAAAYGLDEEITREYLDIQIMVDYLITNRDRHQGNIGFLRDPDTLKILTPAPIFDSGSSESLEYEYPIDLENTKVNGLYFTEGECLANVSDKNRIDLAKLPDKKSFISELEKSAVMSEQRKEFLASMYERKISYLKNRQ